MYSLVEFLSDNGQKPEVEVVPNTWLHEKESEWYCLWPKAMPTGLIRKAIEKAYVPDKDWINYNCRLLHTCDSYSDARKKLVDAELTSTLESDAEMHKYQRPKRKLKRLRLYSDSSESNGDKEAACNKIPSPPKLRTPTKYNNVSPRTSTIVTPCKSSTLTVISSNLSNTQMNNKKSYSGKSNASATKNSDQSFSKKKISSKRSPSVASNYDQSSSRKIISSSRSSSVASNYDQSSSRKIISPSRSSSVASNYDQSSSRKIISPSRSSSVASNYDQSSSRKIISPRRSSSVASNYDQSSSRKIISPRRSSSVASNYDQSFSRKIISSRRSSSVESNYDQSFSRKIISPRHSSNVASNYDQSSSRKMISSRRSSSVASNYDQSSSRKMISPRHSSSIASNDDQSSSRNINSSNLPPHASVNYEKSCSKQFYSSRRLTSTAKSCYQSSSRKITSPRHLSNVTNNYDQSFSRKSNSPISRIHSTAIVPQRSPLRDSHVTTITPKCNKSDVSYLVLTKVVSLEKSINLLLPMVKQLMAHFRITKLSHMENVPKIPVDCRQDLKNLEKFLDRKENFDYMVNILSISGGITISQMTRRTLERLITNNYATNYNWAGRAPKRAFKSLKIKDLIVATVRSVESNANVNVIENSIKDWLKLSSVRVTLTEARALKKNASIATKSTK